MMERKGTPIETLRHAIATDRLVKIQSRRVDTLKAIKAVDGQHTAKAEALLQFYTEKATNAWDAISLADFSDIIDRMHVIEAQAALTLKPSN